MSEVGRRTLFVLGICVAWALTSVAPLLKYLSPAKATGALILGSLSIAIGMSWILRLNLRPREISIAWLLLLFLALTTAFAILYPISLRHTLNIGSDREDALRIELLAIGHHQYPYDTRTFLGNPPTPLPGAMLLAAPFYALGHIAWQNLLWLALFFFFALRFFRYRSTALFYLAVFLLFAPAHLSDFSSGGDYLTNFFYIAIAVTLFSRSLNHSLYASIPAALFLGVALSSRILYAVILIPLLSLTLQRTFRLRAAVLFFLILLSTCAITLPVFWPHPLSQLLLQLQQNANKLRYIPTVIHPQWTLPLLAILVASAAFWVRMDLPRLFLIFGAAIFVMLAPFVITFAIHSDKLRYAFFYLSVSTLSFSLWALSRCEHSEGNTHLIPPAKRSPRTA
ncbi:hypothetical protein [Tunturiibacter gelidiferens]|uniref:DUF2029 domain-containing protein n=1 Tax=Tunturiibacter gelidiferens TaxID=3069689 RepID=A0AAU7Z4D4_9BACT